MTEESTVLEGHGGNHAVAVARNHGVQTMWTLSGAHVFPLYDAAVKAEEPMRLVDVRHEPSAVFAAEATGKLTRTPGLAVLTAGPGVTNGVSPVAQAQFNGSPLVVIGGRAPTHRWGSGSLQELDHPPIFATITKSALTELEVTGVAGAVDRAFTAAGSSHRGPTFLDVPMDQLFSRAEVQVPAAVVPRGSTPDPGAVRGIGGLLARAERPVLILGTDVWADGAEVAALELVEELGVPTITNGMGRGIIPGGHPMLVTKARSIALGQSDLVVVVGAPLDFRLGYGSFGGKEGAPPAAVVHVADSTDGLAGMWSSAGAAAGDLGQCLQGIASSFAAARSHADWRRGFRRCRPASPLRSSATARCFGRGDPITRPDLRRAAAPAGRRRGRDRRRRRLRVVRGQVRRSRSGRAAGSTRGRSAASAPAWVRRWRLGSPAVEPGGALLGDGAAGMSLMDVDTLVRHQLPVVIVVGNNSAWGLEKGPMQFL
jgi:acetolactate synthase-1/2/3 large subunit